MQVPRELTVQDEMSIHFFVPRLPLPLSLSCLSESMRTPGSNFLTEKTVRPSFQLEEQPRSPRKPWSLQAPFSFVLPARAPLRNPLSLSGSGRRQTQAPGNRLG